MGKEMEDNLRDWVGVKRSALSRMVIEPPKSERSLSMKFREPPYIKSLK